MTPDADATLREELALVDEIRGEERDEQDLRDLARLERDGPDRHPEPATVDRAPDSWRQRQQQRDETEPQHRVPIALEEAHVAYDEEREDEHADPDRDPERLHAREVRLFPDVESRDRDESDAVQQRRERQQRGIRIGREAPD